MKSPSTVIDRHTRRISDRLKLAEHERFLVAYVLGYAHLIYSKKKTPAALPADLVDSSVPDAIRLLGKLEAVGRAAKKGELAICESTNFQEPQNPKLPYQHPQKVSVLETMSGRSLLTVQDCLDATKAIGHI